MSEASRREWFAKHRQANTWLTLSEHEKLCELASQRGESIATVVRDAVLTALAKETEHG